MTLSAYRKSPYWKAAIDLAPSLARLADDLPAGEAAGLGIMLRNLAVQLPAAIAVDLHSGTATRQPVMFQLVAALEIIDGVYPALDTASTRQAADALAEEILADVAPEPVITPAAPVQPTLIEAETTTQSAAASAPIAAPAPSAPPVARPVVNVPVAAEQVTDIRPASPLGANPDAVSAVPGSIQESNVQSDSQQ